MSGICTRQLADVVLVLCAPNDQNLEGVEMMAESFVRPDVLSARGERRLDLVMVPARIDVSEGRPVDVFEANFRSKLDRFTPDAFKRFGAAFTQMRIPYISAYAFAERLAVGEPEGVKSLQEAYAAIATHLALLAPSQSEVRRRCKAELQVRFGMPTVLVGSLDDEGAAWEAALRERLEDEGLFAVRLPSGPFDVWFDTIEVHVVAATAAALGVPTPLGMPLVVSVGAASLADGRIRPLWRRAQECGVCLHLVAAPGTAVHDAPRPRWPQKARLWQPDREWDELLTVLQRPCMAMPVPLLALPPVARLVGREAEVAELKRWLLEPVRREQAVALRGMAGIGKSSIARAICNDDDVLDRFDDGVLWATLGHRGDLTAALAKLVRAMEPANADELDLDEARRRLTNLLRARRCLVVYDDVVDIDQIEMLPQGGDACRVLMTTSSTAVSEQPGVGRVMEIVALSRAASVELLGPDLQSDPDELATLANRLGGSPLALSVASRTARARVRYGGQEGTAVGSLLRDLDQSGLAAIDATPGLSGTGTVLSALNGALELLDTEDRARLPLLAALSPGAPVDARLVASASNCTIDEARAMLQRLATASLVHFDADADVVRIDPLVHEFLRSLEIRERRVETTMIAYRGPARQRGVYISYRREDTGHYATRLYDRLTRHFGVDRVFMDTASLRLGEPFATTIASNLQRTGAMVVLIGPRWLEGLAKGDGRLDGSSDFVFREVSTALDRNVPVVPVLLDGAPMPAPNELPPALSELFLRNSVEIAAAQFESNTDALVGALTRILDAQPPPSPPPDLSGGAPDVAVGVSDLFDGGWPPSRVVLAHERAHAHDPLMTSAAPTSGGPGEPVARAASPFRRRLVSIGVTAAVLVVAASWFTLSATPTSAPTAVSTQGAADFAQAEALYFGRDGTRDPKRALKLYRQAAELGNASAQNSLGRLYELGDGVARDEAQAIRYYRDAARQGHPDAKAALARLQAPR